MTNGQLVWAIDCDDVIVPTAQVIVDAYNAKYQANVTLDAFYNNDDTWGALSKDEAIRRVGDLLREGLTDETAPSRETIEALQHLASMDELHLVTGRQTYREPATFAMLKKYLPGVFRTVEHTNYYLESNSVLKTRSKGEVCRQIGADVLVDDHVAHGRSVLESGLKEVIVWGDYPWNRAAMLDKGMVRCITWSEVFRERDRILAQQ